MSPPMKVAARHLAGSARACLRIASLVTEACLLGWNSLCA